MKSIILMIVTAGGKIICARCAAKSKRTGNQCGKPALKCFSLEIDFNSYELGLGYRMPISRVTDTYGSISGQNQKITASGANESNTHTAFAIGVKTLLADSLQLDANGGMLDGDFRGKLELQYKVTSTIGAVANYTNMKDAGQYNFGIRYFY